MKILKTDFIEISPNKKVDLNYFLNFGNWKDKEKALALFKICATCPSFNLFLRMQKLKTFKQWVNFLVKL